MNLTNTEFNMILAAHERSPSFNINNTTTLIKWAEDAKTGDEIQAALFSLIQKGLITIHWNNNDDDAVFTRAILQ